MASTPLAYHLTFGTHGARLHGDERGTVDREHNCPGDPLLPPDPQRVARERTIMSAIPIELSIAHRAFIEGVIPSICERGGWGYHISAAGKDHIHVLLSSNSDPTVVRRLAKRWLGQSLSSRWETPDAGWWADGGSTKYVWDTRYFRRAFDYIAEQRSTDGAAARERAVRTSRS